MGALTCLASHSCSRLTLLTTCPSVLRVAGDSGESGLGAPEELGGGSGLSGASTAGHWVPAGSSGGSGEAVVGELLGEADELGVPPGGALSRSVTVVTSWLVPSGVGVGSGTSVCCSCSLTSDTCGGPTGFNQGFPTLSATPTHGGQGWQVPKARACKVEGLSMSSCGHLHKNGVVSNPYFPVS